MMARWGRVRSDLVDEERRPVVVDVCYRIEARPEGVEIIWVGLWGCHCGDDPLDDVEGDVDWCLVLERKVDNE